MAPNDCAVTTTTADDSTRRNPSTGHPPPAPEPETAGGCAAAATAPLTLLPDIGAVDAFDVIAYLLEHRWHHHGLIRHSHDITSWSHRDHGELTVAVDPRRDGADILLRYTIARLAMHERRPAADLLADIAATGRRLPHLPPAGHAPAAAVDPVTGMLELRLRHDYTRYHRLRTVERDRGGAGELEWRWRRVHIGGCADWWRQLHAITEAWIHAPTVMLALLTVLDRHHTAVDPMLLRHHQHARALTADTPALAPTTENR